MNRITKKSKELTRVNTDKDLTSEKTIEKKNKRIHKSSDKNSQKSVETGSTVIGKRSMRSRTDNDSTIQPMYIESSPSDFNSNDNI